MMTHFKQIIILVLGFIFHGYVLSDIPVKDFFISHKEEILDGTLDQGQGYYLQTATATPRLPSMTSRRGAISKAELRAKVAILKRHALNKIEWPQALQNEHKIILIQNLIDILPYRGTLRNALTIYTESDQHQVKVVVAIPIDDIEQAQLTTDHAYQYLFHEKNVHSRFSTIDSLCALRAVLGTLPITLDRTPWKWGLDTATFTQLNLYKLPKIAGVYPIGKNTPAIDKSYTQGMVAYHHNRLEDAYRYFLESLDHTYTFDAFNMAGNVARRIGKERESVALLLHAAYLNPSSAYPWIHLAYASKQVSQEKAYQMAIKKAQMCILDTWSKQHLQNLKKKK